MPGIIFAPEQIAKKELEFVVGTYPSDDLCPGYGVFPNGGIELYDELDEVDTLDVFGLSPYGDKGLAEKINSKNKVRIFVHKLKNNAKDVDEWNRLLTCDHEFLDSELL